jgi:drug/metabolite transporter (DMT)-like permease
LKPIEKGIFFALIAYICYTIAVFLIKVISLPFSVIVFARNVIGFCFFLPIFFLNLGQLKTKRFFFHWVRTCLSLATIYCSTYAIQHLNLSDAILLEQTTPFFILAISFFWKREKMSRASITAILIAFIGVGCILKPHFDFWNIGAVISLLAAFFAALSYISIESLSQTESSIGILFYFLGISSLLSVGPAMGYWTEITSTKHIVFLVTIGILFALFHYLLNRAFVFVNANFLGSYIYFVSAFSLILGYFFLNEELSLSRLTGCLCIIGAGIYIFYEKRKQLQNQ